MSPIVEELEEVHRSSVEHLPEDDDADDSKNACGYELERHAERVERGRDERAESVADVDVVAERSAVGVARVKKRVRRPNAGPFVEGLQPRQRNRAREHFGTGRHAAAAVVFAKLVVFRLDFVLAHEKSDFPPRNHHVHDEKERERDLCGVEHAVGSVVQPDVKRGQPDDERCDGDDRWNRNTACLRLRSSLCLGVHPFLRSKMTGP